jgi:hypothetical protein
MTSDQIHEKMKHRQPEEAIVYKLGDLKPAIQLVQLPTSGY